MISTIFSGYLQWFFRVSAFLFVRVSWRTLVWCRGRGRGVQKGGCFYKVVGHRVFRCIQVVCWCFHGDFLLFRSGSISEHCLVVISHFYLSLYLYYYPLLFSLCVNVWVFYNCDIRTLHVHMCMSVVDNGQTWDHLIRSKGKNFPTFPDILF